MFLQTDTTFKLGALFIAVLLLSFMTVPSAHGQDNRITLGTDMQRAITDTRIIRAYNYPYARNQGPTDAQVMQQKTERQTQTLQNAIKGGELSPETASRLEREQQTLIQKQQDAASRGMMSKRDRDEIEKLQDRASRSLNRALAEERNNRNWRAND